MVGWGRAGRGGVGWGGVGEVGAGWSTKKLHTSEEGAYECDDTTLHTLHFLAPLSGPLTNACATRRFILQNRWGEGGGPHDVRCTINSSSEIQPLMTYGAPHRRRGLPSHFRQWETVVKRGENKVRYVTVTTPLCGYKSCRHAGN